MPHDATAAVTVGPAASIVDSTAALTAQYWWYFATRFTRPVGSSLNTMN